MKWRWDKKKYAPICLKKDHAAESHVQGTNEISIFVTKTYIETLCQKNWWFHCKISNYMSYPGWVQLIITMTKPNVYFQLSKWMTYPGLIGSIVFFFLEKKYWTCTSISSANFSNWTVCTCMIFVFVCLFVLKWTHIV